MKLRTTILFVLIITVMLSAGFFASEVLAQGCTDSAGQPVECPSSDDDGEDKNDDDADPATVFRFLSINENYLDPSNWNNNGSLPGPGQNARLDGQRAIIDPNSPEVIPLGSLILRNNANLTIRDARLEFETLDSVNSGIEVYNSYIKAKTFIDPGGGGILFNPSFLEADRIILYKAETPIRFGLGGETPTDPSALGLGHYARMQGRAVDLDGQLGIFTVYGFHPEPGQEFEIISVSGANHVNGTFANAPEGAIIDGFCDVQLRISYMGGDGNDVVLTAEERTTPDPKCAENFDNPSSEKNVFLDGAEIDISPEEPLEVQDITLVKGAEWNLHDGIISAQSVNAENADLFLSNGCFVLYGWGFGKGTIKLNPSCISAEVFTQRDSQSSLVLELGGTEPAIPENRGLGHFAHIQADRVRLNGELELFSIYGFHPEPGQQFEIISVGNSLKGEFVNAPEGSIIDGFCDVQLRISYMGGDGNDVVLTAEERTTPDPKCAENFDNPSSEKNVFLDGAEIDISPEEPLEVQDITLVNGAEWNLRDGFVSARVVDAHNSSINLFNSYLKAETFIDPGGSNGGGITFNPSFLEAERIVLYKPETLIQIGLGGKLPAGPDALGAGHHARMSGDFVSLDVTLDIFTLYGFHPKPGQQFEIISVGNSLEGEFVNAPEGSVIDGFCDVQLRISYMGGDGNDVVLTAEETERTWPCEKTPDGNNWSDSDSWENGVPNATDDVVLDNSSMLVAQEDIEIKRMTVKNGATLQIEDSIFIAEEIRVDGGTVQVNNTELVLNQTGVFCEICGMSLNPSYLDTQSLRATGKYFSFALGGEKPANTGAVGSGYHARISAKGVELDTELEVSFVYDFQPQAGQEFEIITVDDSLRGAFINAPEGAVVGGYCDVELKISYTGGDGNDVVLSAEKTTNPDPNWPCEDQKEEAENMNAPSQDLGGEEKTSSLLPFLGGILIIIIFVAVLRKKKKA